MGAMWAGNTSPWFMVHGNETTGSNTAKLFDDTATDVTITYEALPSQSLLDTTKNNPANGGIAISTQPTFFATTSTDPDGPAPILYRFTIGTSSSTPAYNPYNLTPSVGSTVWNSGLSTSNQWTVPDNTLQDGTTYYWQVSAKDSLSGSPEVYSPAYSFKVDTRNGKDATQAFDAMGPVSVDLASGNLTTSTQTHSITALGGSLGLNLDYNSPQVSRRGLVGSYWNDNGSHTIPTGVTPPLQRVDPNIDFTWNSNSPYTGIINQSAFVARWDGYFIAPQDGTYQFGTSSDHGSRIYTNANYSTAYLDQWSATPNDVFGGTVTLSAGQILPIRYEYYANTGTANAHLRVKSGTITDQIVDQSWLQTGVRPVSTPHGLVGRYYTDDGSHNFPTQDDPTRLFITRTDSSLTQNWGSGSPVPNGPSTNFMVRWSGSYLPPVSGTYNFQATASDGVRVTVGSTTAIDSWVDHEPAATVGPTNAVSLTGGVPVSINVDYYQKTGTDQISLLVNRPDAGPTTYVPVDTSSLLPQAQTLPDGWGLGIDADGNLGYDYAYFGLNSVTLRDSTGNTHEYKFANGGFTPPAGEDGHMVRNGDGTVTFQDADGRTYVFSPSGTLKSSSTPTDDRNPAALQYIYGGSPAHITQISDAVTDTAPGDPSTATRWLKILYAGDTNCPTVPTGFAAYSSVTGMICAAYTSDGTQTLPVSVANNNVTRFLYTVITHPDGTTAPFLSRVERPGSDYTDYGYDLVDATHSLGRIASTRDTLANDAVTAGVRSQDGTEVTSIAYDALGHVSTATLPAATAGATRLAHTYNYYQGKTAMHVTGATEPNGFTRQVLYDGTLRTTDDYDVANLDTKTKWDPAKDLAQSTTDPAGLMSTTLYDYADRPTDQYGPAPSTWFDTTPTDAGYDKPLTTPTDYTPQVPHKQTAYDGSINGLAAAYYDVASYTNGTGSAAKALFGAPKLHGTGIAAGTGDVNKTWAGTPPFTLDPDPAYPPSGKYGWGARLSGYINLASTGTYAFRINSDDGVRLWIDDTLVIDDWTDGASRSHTMIPGYAGFNNTASSNHRVRLDYYNKAVSGTPDTDAALTLFMTPPGGSETSALGTLLNPGYGLKTSETTYDSSAAVGNTTTNYGYGTNPELGLVQTTTVDPSGLNLITTNTYETQGASGSFLRQTAKYLPGANTATASTGTQYTYYGANETRDNPCTTGTVEAYNQAGRLKITTQPDPDGTGSQTPVSTETIYDDAGRVVATRFNAETSWTCYTYDSRGRMTQRVIPAQANTAHVTRSARTTTINYSYNLDPQQTLIQDNGQDWVSTKVDLLGRTAAYTQTEVMTGGLVVSTTTNYGYDNLGRLSSKSPGLNLTYEYDNNNRLTAEKASGITLASPTYDAYGRLQQVSYPNARSLKVNIARDNLGRINNYDYTLGNGTSHVIDTTTLSQSSNVVSGTENGAAKTYTYDKAGRLTNATLGSNTFAYTFGAPTTCTGTFNANAGKNANRTTQVLNGATTTYCYDYADRLTNSSNAEFNSIAYDAHGNMSQGSAFNKLEYDSSDRSVYIGDSGIVTTKRDPTDRTTSTSSCGCTYFYGDTSDQPAIVRNTAGTSVLEYLLSLPGNILLTLRSLTLNSSLNVYSLPNLHGDAMATADGTGSLIGTFQYTPTGSNLTAYANNGQGNDNFGTLGQYGKITYTATTTDYVQMGARLYAPNLGRFTQVDPVDGGVENAYVYPPDPVNDKDITGQCPMCVLAVPLLYEALEAFSEGPSAGELRYSTHAAQRLVQRGFTKAEVRAAVKYGRRFLDVKHPKTIVYNLGRVYVSLNPQAKLVITLIRKFIQADNKRYIRIK